MNFNKIKEPFVLMLIGVPLSGKSYFVKNFIENINKNVTVISRDQIMMDDYGDDNYMEAYKNVNQRKVNSILHTKFVESNRNKDNVIIDMTNLSSKRRRNTLSYFDDDYTKIGIIFPVLEWDKLVERNIKRTEEENKNIPEHVIKSMLSSYQPIRQYDEGFDKVISI